jgi:hypothetical protein
MGLGPWYGDFSPELPLTFCRKRLWLFAASGFGFLPQAALAFCRKRLWLFAASGFGFLPQLEAARGLLGLLAAAL